MVKNIITFILLAFIGWFVWNTYRGFKSATGTIWERLLGSTKNSAVLFWTALVSVVTAGWNSVLNFTDFLGMPEVREFATKNFTPEMASGIMLGVMFIIALARLRPKSPDPVAIIAPEENVDPVMGSVDVPSPPAGSN